MKRFFTVALAVTATLALAGAAFAQMGGPGYGGGPGYMGGQGRMWGGGMGPWMMGGAGQYGCPGAAGVAQQQGATQITEDQAKDLAQQYADQYLKGFKVDKVLPFAGRGGAMYSVELQGPDGQMRTLHVNPWGNVMPFGGPSRRAS